jgi:RHS repeat-associated protein
MSNGLWVDTCFNERQQATRMLTSPADTLCSQVVPDKAKLGLTYGFGASTTNNGNVASELIQFGVPSGPSSWWLMRFTQNYGYDALGRLKTMTDTGGVSQTYVHDRYGNRALLANSYAPAQPAAPQVTADQASQVEAIFQTSGVSRNRWMSAVTNAVGNVTQPVTGAYPILAYDAENRVTSAQTGPTATMMMEYDGEGRRVKVVQGGVPTWFVYGMQGAVVAEYGGPAVSTGSGTSWVTADALGSTRLTTGGFGQVLRRMDYTPYGNSLLAGVGGRSTSWGYEDDNKWRNWSRRFTGKERDAETGLDYFGARYVSGAQGRFTSPDTPLIDQFLDDPQSWNLYAYARNNPLRYVDRTGEAIELVGDAEGRRKQLEALKEAVGSEARAYLYPNAEKDKNNKPTGRYFVGVLVGGPSGKGPDFASINGASKALSGVIADTQIAQVHLVNPGESFTYFSPTNRQTSLNSRTTGLTSPFNEPSPIKVWVLNPAYAYDDLSPKQMANGLSGQRTLPDNLMHELGHAAWQMDIKAGRRTANDPYGNQRAVDFENYLRLRLDMGRRSIH